MLQRHPAIVVAVIGLLPFVLAACSDAASSSTDPRMQPPLVRIETVAISVPSERSFTGIVAARVQSDLGFRVPGKVLERLVNAGQTVKRGQTLMRIDPTDLTLAVRAHDEAVAAARARARQTAADELRYRDLVAGGAVSASAYDKVKADAEAARAQLNAAQARADVARNETGYADLLADADGVVVETLAAPGDRIHRAGDLVWKRADGPCETPPVVGRRKPSHPDVRGPVRAGGPSGGRAARLDHLHPDIERPVRGGAAGTDRRDLRSRQGSRRLAGPRRNAPGHLAGRANRRPQRRSGFCRRQSRSRRSRRGARCASAARRRARATHGDRGRTERARQRRERAMRLPDFLTDK